MDEDERQRVVQVEEANQERARKLYEKQEEESLLKQKRKAEAKSALQGWTQDRQKQKDLRKSLNKQMEKDSEVEKKRLRETTNPWERVVANVEIQANQYVGQGDVSRMRQSMIARKNDLTKSSKKGMI